MQTKTKPDLKDILQDRVNALAVKNDAAADDTTDTTNDSGNIISDNLALYNKVRAVPPEAQKEITGGRLSGFTDINPMWRIKTLTEQFGICGIGWYYDITRMWLEHGANDEIAAFVEIDLYIKQNDEWSKPIKGLGGSSFVAKESKGLYTSDECFKMALTDAISTSCKSLGFAADIYFNKDRTKYDTRNQTEPDVPPSSDTPSANNVQKPELTENQIKRLYAISKKANVDKDTLKKIMMKHFNKELPEILTRTEYDFICTQLEDMIAKQKSTA